MRTLFLGAGLALGRIAEMSPQYGGAWMAALALFVFLTLIASVLDWKEVK